MTQPGRRQDGPPPSRTTRGSENERGPIEWQMPGVGKISVPVVRR